MSTRTSVVARLVAVAVVLSGCQAAPPRTPAVHLTAALVSPTDVALRWNGTGTVASTVAGWVVEFATQPDGQFAVLQIVPPHQLTLRHPDLMPSTTFYYRVRPVQGPASAAVDVSLPAGDLDPDAHRDDPDWAAPRTRPDASATKRSIRDPGTASAAAPTDLHATVMDANGIGFTWTDHSEDEDGFLLEVRAAGTADFSVAAVLDPDVNSYGLVTLPTEKHASYRVRAFSYGPSSNLARQTTGQDG